MSDEIPIWLEPVALAQWPTQIVESQALRYRLALRQGWNATPQVNRLPTHVEHIFRGVYPSESLMVSFMENAEPAADLRNWIEAIMGLAGFPLVAMVPANNDEGRPELLEWQYQGSPAALAERLEVDEIQLYQGLGKLTTRPPELARLYVLLARRETWAWNISLSFISACPPGAPEATVIKNDHVRAGATFGPLCLLK